MDPDPAHAHEDLWVFAYGSLMWRRSFRFSSAFRLGSSGPIGHCVFIPSSIAALRSGPGSCWGSIAAGLAVELPIG